MAGFYVYEYVHHEGRRGEVRTVLHHGDCRWCQNGQGRPTNAGLKRGLGRWHGPFDSVADALDAAGQIADPLACHRCRPF
jgi:hypothetical protein